MLLETLLKQRLELRAEYADREKALSSEIKEVILRVKELDENEGKIGNLPAEEIPSNSEVAATTEAESDQYTNKEQRHGKREYTHVNYHELKKHVETILKTSNQPIQLSDLIARVEQIHGTLSSTPYITIKKVLKLLSGEITEQKQGRSLYISWKHDG